ncbi:class I SAM-dependent methyltransferase [Rudanella lutea]|uniref:class I SAM-dependent methyltransferase n=1 Tax=Rudanella lutea TaxID=451374 RepID=UPI00037D782A|nr:class I SAM-dependent methyltransferase [Rudanella lutea]
MQLYNNKKPIYFSQIREDLIAQIPSRDGNRVLDIGAGGCDTLLALKERGIASEVYAVELFAIPNSNQNNPIIDKLFIGDIENQTPDFPLDYFDVIMCGDVLEHLVNPWAAVEKLSRYLKQGGVIIASCPNIREITNWSRILLKGSFHYEQSGIMDKTHLRFFCMQDMIEMLTTPELKPIKSQGNYFIAPR